MQLSVLVCSTRMMDSKRKTTDFNPATLCMEATEAHSSRCSHRNTHRLYLRIDLAMAEIPVLLVCLVLPKANGWSLPRAPVVLCAIRTSCSGSLQKPYTGERSKIEISKHCQHSLCLDGRSAASLVSNIVGGGGGQCATQADRADGYSHELGRAGCTGRSFGRDQCSGFGLHGCMTEGTCGLVKFKR